jgi:rhamnose utilization protein RhaD (predicted bifunctional aldolase and dehydrogenase)
MEEKIIADLIAMARHLGHPESDAVILAEGNVSAKLDSKRFIVKASGAFLKDLCREDLVTVSFEKVLSILQMKNVSQVESQSLLQKSVWYPKPDNHPSSETFFHAILLNIKDVKFIGHTHPTAVNAILCSQNAADTFTEPIFPYQEVVCGPKPMYVPYAEPGFNLAIAILERLQTHLARWGSPPRVILLQNHGMIALGETAQDVEMITAVFIKAARTFAGTTAFGGPRYLS